MSESRENGPSVDWREALAQVAGRLRQLRRRRGLTLAQVAEATGISVSTLSRLESGSRRPALDVLLPLAQAYQVPLDHLVGAPESGDPRIHPRPVQRRDMVYIPLSRRVGGVHAFKLILPGQRSAPSTQLRTHEGTEWMYVLSGQARLLLGDSTTVLAPGETVEFDSHVPHGIHSANDDPVEILTLFSPQGEQIHIAGD